MIKYYLIFLLFVKPKWKEKYFYIRGDIWNGEPVVPVCSTWNNNFDTSQPRGQEVLLHLGYEEREKDLLLEALEYLPHDI